jgi:hypothetical protein
MLNASKCLEISVVQLVMHYEFLIVEILGVERREVEVTRDCVGEINGAKKRANHVMLLLAL